MILRSLLQHPLAIWGILALVGIAALLFGAISLTTNLFVAVGIGLMVVGVAQLFRAHGNPAIALGITLLGGFLWWGHELLPALSIGTALSYGGAP